ncbi:hypothetical protein G3I40_03585 [Streptomyces sp. SID14478]|uniref:hypothetical protein n=1 Tax=Streptomyces sp. SID14478 TaxID=2706073 RepID=UPI0013DBF627|nr:hypothetical protein [Streptomyces sp. SID14478]NEB74320.1 hypothetical protein [Streptomyces sp. SID14478]
MQVADRWHLWHNLSEAAERSVAQHRLCLRVLTPAPAQPEPETTAAPDPSTSPWPTGHRFADRTRGRHAAVHALLEAGHSRRSVQRQRGMAWHTVKRFADAAKPEDLFTGKWQNRSSVLDDSKPYLDDRWNQGSTHAWKLWEEIVPLGYKGSYQRVRAYLREKRTSPRPVTARPPSPRAVAGWISGARTPSPSPSSSSSKPSGGTAPNSTLSPSTKGRHLSRPEPTALARRAS